MQLPSKIHGALVAFMLSAVVGCSQSPAPVRGPGPVSPDDDLVNEAAARVDARVPSQDMRAHAQADTGPDTGWPDEVELACQQHLDCRVSCGEGRCVDGLCRFDLSEACVIANDAGKQARCVPRGQSHPAHDCLWCAPELEPMHWSGRALDVDFSSGPELAPFSPEQAGPIAWVRSADRAHAGEFSAHFGQGRGEHYGGGQRVMGQLRSPWMSLPPGFLATLHFWLWLETEMLPGFDQLGVFVETSDGRTLLWQSDAIGGTTAGEFLPVAVDLSAFDDLRFRLIFEFDSNDGLINDFEGAYIDAIRILSRCCQSDADCDDANPCTEDRCPATGAVCVQTPRSDCCLNASSCVDDDPCTLDACPEAGLSCEHTARAACCREDSDCDDGDPCTEDRCPLPGGACEHRSLCCQVDEDCEQACGQGRCAQGGCIYPGVCCDADTDCADEDACTEDRCVAGTCRHVALVDAGCCSAVIAYEGFDDGVPPDWVMTEAQEGLGWSVLPGAEGVSSSGVLYYGNADTGRVALPGVVVTGQVTTAPMALPSGVSLSLKMTILIDSHPSLLFDKFWVIINGVGEPAVVVTKAVLLQGRWTPVELDISALAGRSISLTFAFDSQGAPEHAGRGVFIDELTITSTCAPLGCEGADRCPTVGGCLVGRCEQGSCDYQDECCADDLACDDDDPCTNDQCLAGSCYHTPLTVEDCCVPEPMWLDFEQDPGLVFTATAPPCAWHLADMGLHMSGAQVLYYGDPAAANFDCGLSAGQVETPVVHLPEGANYELSFYLWMDTQPHVDLDTLSVMAVLEDGSSLNLWSKQELSDYGQWVTVTRALGALAGRSVRLRFEFNTIDGSANQGLGVLIDDLRIGSTCGPIPCSVDADCDDGLSGTQQWCLEGSCRFAL